MAGGVVIAAVGGWSVLADGWWLGAVGLGANRRLLMGPLGIFRRARGLPEWSQLVPTCPPAPCLQPRRMALPQHGPTEEDTASPDLFPVTLSPDFSLEDGLRREGLWPVAGVDEAGRGPLAGPVVTAAVILDPARIPPGLNDSKKLTAVRREALFDLILTQALAVSVASASPAEIDRTDVLKANLAAMAQAVRGLAIPAGAAIIDGRDVPPGLPCPGRAVVKGDARSLSIAAASIIAKVTRDRMMAAADTAFPGYGFAAHAGYGTAAHLAAIQRLGPCPLHRMTFKPLKGV